MTFKNNKDYIHFLKNRSISLDKFSSWKDEYLDKEIGRDIEIMRKSTMMFGVGVIFMATTLSIFLFSTKSYWGISGLISFGAMSLVMFFEGFFERSHEKARIKGLQVNQ
jgi:hypothetical protein